MSLPQFRDTIHTINGLLEIKDIDSAERNIEQLHESIEHAFNNAIEERTELQKIKHHVDYFKAEVAFRKSFLDQAYELYYSLKDLPEDEYPATIKAKTLTRLGDIHREQGKSDSAIEYYSQACSMYSIIGNVNQVCKINILMGDIFRKRGEYDKSLKQLHYCLSLASEHNDKDSIANALLDLGMIYIETGDYKQALIHLHKGKDFSKKQNNIFRLGQCLMILGHLHKSNNELHDALTYYNQALPFLKEVNNPKNYAVCKGLIGGLYSDSGMYDQALNNFHDALEIFNTIHDKQNIGFFSSYLSELYIKMNDLDTALIYCKKAIDISLELEQLRNLYDNYSLMANICFSMEDYDNALSYSKLSHELERSVRNQESIKQMQIIENQFWEQEQEKDRLIQMARFKEQERIFHNIFPLSIADRLIEGETLIADSLENVSIVFLDIVEFTSRTSLFRPIDLITLLNDMFKNIDMIATRHGLEKIKTIGDAYMAVSGLDKGSVDHEMQTALFALDVMKWINEKEDSTLFKNFQIRIGLHCGPVIAGIIGKNKFAYDIWGETVNIAAKMESQSEPGRIHITSEFANAIHGNEQCTITPRGDVFIKGKGYIRTFWLEYAT